MRWSTSNQTTYSSACSSSIPSATSAGQRYCVVSASQMSESTGAMWVSTVSDCTSHPPQWFMFPVPSSSSGGASWPSARRRIASLRSSCAAASRGCENETCLILSTASSGTVTTSGTIAAADARSPMGVSIASISDSVNISPALSGSTPA